MSEQNEPIMDAILDGIEEKYADKIYDLQEKVLADTKIEGCPREIIAAMIKLAFVSGVIAENASSKFKTGEN